MTDPLQTMLQQIGVKTTTFSPTSRYFGIETVRLDVADKNSIVYLRRRFVPPAESFFLLQEHTVTQGERLDNITHQYLGDPERFWQLCDANNVIRPDDLTETTGRRIRITLPEGIPGNSDNNA